MKNKLSFSSFYSQQSLLNNAIYILMMVYMLAACNNRERAQAEQKQREDSIRIATENAVRQRLDRIQQLKDSLTSVEAEHDGFSNRLIIFKADLEAAQDKLGTIRQYQLLRTPNEREEQIRNQTIVIEQIEQEVEAISAKINLCEEAARNIRAELIKLQ